MYFEASTVGDIWTLDFKTPSYLSPTLKVEEFEIRVTNVLTFLCYTQYRNIRNAIHTRNSTQILENLRNAVVGFFWSKKQICKCPKE